MLFLHDLCLFCKVFRHHVFIYLFIYPVVTHTCLLIKVYIQITSISTFFYVLPSLPNK